MTNKELEKKIDLICRVAGGVLYPKLYPFYWWHKHHQLDDKEFEVIVNMFYKKALKLKNKFGCDAIGVLDGVKLPLYWYPLEV